MSMANTRSEDGGLEECIVVSIDTSNRTLNGVMYGVVYKSTYDGDKYQDVLCDQVCFRDPRVPLSSTIHMPMFSMCRGTTSCHQMHAMHAVGRTWVWVQFGTTWYNTFCTIQYNAIWYDLGMDLVGNIWWGTLHCVSTVSF